jgi:hypothetical protein
MNELLDGLYALKLSGNLTAHAPKSLPRPTPLRTQPLRLSRLHIKKESSTNMDPVESKKVRGGGTTKTNKRKLLLDNKKNKMTTAKEEANKKRSTTSSKTTTTATRATPGKKNRWTNGKGTHQYMKVQTKREDQGARTPKWLLCSLKHRFGTFHDPCPHAAKFRVDGLKSKWKAVNYINPPFQDCKAWFKKGAKESVRGNHCIFLVPASRLHRSYFSEIFKSVTAIEILSRTIAFEGYDSALPQALMLLHMGEKVPRLLTIPPRLHQMKVPAPHSFFQVSSMVTKCGIKCHVLGNVLSMPLRNLMKKWKLHGRSAAMAILFPSRLETPAVHSEVLPHTIGMFACVGTLRPTATSDKVWSPSILAVFGPRDSCFKKLVDHPWVQPESTPITSFDVMSAMENFQKASLETKPPKGKTRKTTEERKAGQMKTEILVQQEIAEIQTSHSAAAAATSSMSEDNTF